MSLYAYVLEAKSLNDVLKDVPEGMPKLDYAIMYDKGLPDNNPCYLVSRVDVYKEMDACDKDDFILFASDGKGIIDENTNKCADDQQIENFKWALLNDDSKIAIIDSNPDTMEVEITATEMKLKTTKPNSSGTPVTSRQTYKNIK